MWESMVIHKPVSPAHGIRNCRQQPSLTQGKGYFEHCLNPLTGGEVDFPLVYFACVMNGELALEKATRLKPSYVMLENPSFSCLDFIFTRILSCFAVHSHVLLYHAVACAPIALQDYPIPCDDSLEKMKEKSKQHMRGGSRDRVCQ